VLRAAVVYLAGRQRDCRSSSRLLLHFLPPSFDGAMSRRRHVWGVTSFNARAKLPSWSRSAATGITPSTEPGLRASP
jgi:hypothetical protein